MSKSSFKHLLCYVFITFLLFTKFEKTHYVLLKKHATNLVKMGSKVIEIMGNTSENGGSEDEENEDAEERSCSVTESCQQMDKKPNRLNGEYSYKNVIKRRVMTEPCSDCKLLCNVRVAENYRQDNYAMFWRKLKTWDERRTHLRRLIQVLKVPRLKHKTRKKFLRKYYLQIEDGFTLVCKTMFFNTLSVSAKFVETTLQTFPKNALDESKMKMVNRPKLVTTKLIQGKQRHEQILHKSNKDLSANKTLLSIGNKHGIKPPCTCPRRCAERVSEEARLKVYNHFWTKLQSWQERKLYIMETIKTQTFMLPIQDKDQVPVCQEMYLNTLSVSEKMINRLVPKLAPITTKEVPQLTRSTKPEYTPLQPPCSCELQCGSKFTENIRQQIHTEFWNLPTQVDQKYFILSTITQSTKGNKQEITNFMLPRNCDSTIVCKEMYLHTLAVPEDFILSTIRNIGKDGCILDDEMLPEKNTPANPDVTRTRKKRAKKLGPPCPSSCRLKCNQKFSEQDRNLLHMKFWSQMTWLERKLFVLKTVKEFPIKNRSVPGRITKRNFSRIYTLPYKEEPVTVCQKMYFSTLSICSKFISKVHVWAAQVNC